MFFVLNRDGNRIRLDAHYIIAFVFILLYAVFFPICYQLSVNGYNTKSFSEWIKQYSEISVAVYFLLIAAVSHTFLFILKMTLLPNLVGSTSEGSPRYLRVSRFCEPYMSRDHLEDNLYSIWLWI